MLKNKMKQITVKKEVLINTGKFENVKIVAEIVSDKFEWEELDSELNNQEALERAKRLPVKEVIDEKMPF